jgi:hypothetical protein
MVHGAGDRLVIAQQADEAPASLAARLARRLERLRAEGRRLGSGWLACNGRLDAVAFAARALMARAMLAALGSADGGALVLVACGGGAGARVRFLGFADVLLDELQVGRISLAVRFSPDAPRPGIKKTSLGSRTDHSRRRATLSLPARQ